jgi:VWFA-related protein
MVTLEVVVRDHEGRHVSGLNANDFQVLEGTPSRGRRKREEKIAAFQEIKVANLTSRPSGQLQIPAGVYTNLVVKQQNPVPATILLLDGLNTDVKYQAQIHVQMVRMLRSLPTDVPVAVFLLGRRLEMLQDFTTDPKLLKAILESAPSTAAGVGMATLDPRDDPDTLSAHLDPILIGPEVMQAVTEFEQRIYASSMDIRVYRTIEALSSNAQHVAGYPGRKNLLWISTAFPIYLSPADDFAGYRNYGAQLQKLAGILSDPKVAVYPINAGGVQTSAMYQAGTRPRRLSGDALERETMQRANAEDTMQVVADDTGGKVCTGDNDLADCIRKAVDDSSEFYEIAYYPDSETWDGEYRKIMVKTSRRGLHLAYREGYFATREGGGNPKDRRAELQSACRDYLNATSIFLAVMRLPPDSPEKLKFSMMINPEALTIVPTTDGARQLQIMVGVCTLDEKGSPLQLMTEAIDRKLSARDYRAVLSGGLPHIISIPGPKPGAVRLLVEDVASGRIGSIYIKTDDAGRAAPVATTKPPAQQATQ